MYSLNDSSTTKEGFEPSRVSHNGLAVHHLNHSVTSSSTTLTHLVLKNFNTPRPCHFLTQMASSSVCELEDRTSSWLLQDTECERREPRFWTEETAETEYFI